MIHLPHIFIAISLLGAAAAVAALVIGYNVKNTFKHFALGLSIFTILLTCGAVVNGIIGLELGFYYDQHPCSWVCLGLGSGAALFGIIALILQISTKNIEPKKKKEKIYQSVTFHETESYTTDSYTNTFNPAETDESMEETIFEPKSGKCIFYQEFREGAIEVNGDYITFYKNLLPFTSFKKGRIASIIFINDIQHITYKGCGWFKGVLAFTFKHPNKPFKIAFSKWFPWSSKELNYKMTPIYEYIKNKVINNNK